MEAKMHKDYMEETERLEYIKQMIEEEIVLLSNKTYTVLNEDVIAEIVYMDNQRMKKLETSAHNPYFGRIDFRERNQDKLENIYIGKASLMDTDSDEDGVMLITDWRAPISTLYYDGNIGSVKYNCPAGNIGGELSLKRNYKIENGHLEKITDIDVSALDEMLLEALEDKKDTKLKDIVSTIQSEQNEIIRADLTKSLIIQGVAGSGKTTIALHRIAYLIYTYQHRYRPHEFMIIAPNKLFLQYIEDMLPELGVEDVEQTTMEDLTKNIVAEHFSISEDDDKLKKIIENESDKNLVESLRAISRIKTDLKYKVILEEFVDEIINEILPKDDLIFEGVLIIEASELSRIFHENYKRYSVLKSIKLVKKLMTTRFENSKSDIEDNIYATINQRQINLEKDEKNISNQNEEIKKIHLEQQSRIKNMKKNFIKLMNTYLKEPKQSILKYYEKFLIKDKFINKLISDKEYLMDYFKEMSKNIRTNKMVEIEDLPALMYLQHKLIGAKNISNTKHIVIDEGQDFGTFQYYILRDIMKEATFTILGDIAQGINYHRGTSDWEDVKQKVFKDQCQIKYLQQSYRTTVEIMNAANEVIGKVEDENIILAHPVLRHGAQVEKIKKDSYGDIVDCIATEINKLMDKYNSIAIIGKNNQQCEKIYDQMTSKGIDVQWLKDRESEYSQQIVLLPSYLAKGLEFDCVIIPGGGEDNYKMNKLDGMLLYVCMTRALHELRIYYVNECSELLK
ncbi:RNA polymerase recycling motor HelD [Vallitalea guaymasensis]|uniref:DNA 3'-5' helicase n=1 Tax=Vallitalea guaymasensis TaxID=1185412 RepID=A0A8J8SCA2_9FIRM|nr:RNA polymerase recycling motor HelD [Vallitalea guaymasensis]QUH29618.1 AAA family ATPase [Vallitalea guaymasensis]